MIEITTEFATQLIVAFDRHDNSTLRRMLTNLETQVIKSNSKLEVKKEFPMTNIHELKKASNTNG